MSMPALRTTKSLSSSLWDATEHSIYIRTVRSSLLQSYIYQVLQTIQMKLILLSVWAEPAVLGSTKTALKFKFEI